MNLNWAQRVVDELLATTLQQWIFRSIVVLSAVAALVAAAQANGTWWPFGMFLTVSFASASAVRPDTHVALVTIVGIVAHFVVTVDDPATWWLPIAGVALLIFHSVVALTATIPIGGVVPRPVLTRWARRVAAGGGATCGLWLVVVLFDRREADGNAVLTGLALALAATGAAVAWARTTKQAT